MAQKTMLRAEVYVRALRASQNLKGAEVWVGRAMRHQCPCAVRLLHFFANGEYKLDYTSLPLKSHPGCCDVVYTPLVCFQHHKSGH
jgi:hypothetical protein